MSDPKTHPNQLENGDGVPVKKRALCIGLQYAFAKELSGGDHPPELLLTHRDPLVIKKLLIGKCTFILITGIVVLITVPAQICMSSKKKISRFYEMMGKMLCLTEKTS